MDRAAFLGALVRRLLTGIVAAGLLAPFSVARAELYYLIVSGIGGDPGYAETFAEAAADIV